VTTPQLLQFLPQIREWFPTPIIQEWSLDEYMRSAKELDKRLREKLGDDAKVYDRLDDIPM
jgi:hypothetical protein